MPWACVIGSPIEHSLSPLIHRCLWDCAGLNGWTYLKHEVTKDSLPQWISSIDDECVGVSITMPCKKAVITLLDVVDPQAEALNSVNTLIPTGSLKTGFNTDVYGMSRAIELSRSRADLDSCGRAVIIGSGATAASALAAVVSLGFTEVHVVARAFHNGKVPVDFHRVALNLGVRYRGHDLMQRDELSSCCSSADLVVSTLPSGALDAHVPQLASMPEKSSFLDVSYAPRVTPAIAKCQDRSIPVAFGVDMLVYQAIMQFKLMTGLEADDHAVSAVFDLLEKN